jgi:hypothetical protein
LARARREGFCTAIHKQSMFYTAYAQRPRRFPFPSGLACGTLAVTQPCAARCVVLPGQGGGERRCEIQLASALGHVVTLCGNALRHAGCATAAAQAIAAGGGRASATGWPFVGPYPSLNPEPTPTPFRIAFRQPSRSQAGSQSPHVRCASLKSPERRLASPG